MMTHAISLPKPPTATPEQGSPAPWSSTTLFTGQVRLANGKPQFHFPNVHRTSILTDLKPVLQAMEVFMSVTPNYCSTILLSSNMQLNNLTLIAA